MAYQSPVYQQGKKQYYQPTQGGDFTYIKDPNQLSSLAKQGAIKVGGQRQTLPTNAKIAGQPAKPLVEPSTQPETPSKPQIGSQTAFNLVFGQMMGHATKLQGLQDQKNKLLLQLYDRQLTPEELRTLSPTQQQAIREGNKSLLEYQIMSLNDTIKGRANENTQALQYMMEGYQMDQQELERKKTTAYNTTLALINKFGDLSGLSQESRDAVARGEMPTQQDLIKLGKTLKEQEQYQKPDYQYIAPTEEFGGGVFDKTKGKLTPFTSAPSGQIGLPGSSLALNNPLGIKPGGKFSQFNSIEEGLQAGADLIDKYKAGAYGVNKNTNLMDFSSVWITGKKGNYNTGYTGANIAKDLGVSPDTKIGSIDSKQLAQAVANYESPGWRSSGVTKYDLDTISTRIARQAFGTGVGLSDKDVKKAERLTKEGLAQGKSEQDILLDVIGFHPSKNAELGKSLLNTLTPALGEKGLSGFDAIGLSRLLSEGNIKGAITKVENTVMNQVKKEMGEKFISEAPVVNAVNGTTSIEDKLNDLIKQGNSPVGVVKGTMEKWLRKLKGNEAQRISAEVTGLVAQMRNQLSGTAVTDSEARFLEPLMPELNDNPANFLSKLSALKQKSLRELNSERSQYNLKQLDENSLIDKNLRQDFYISDEEAYQKYLESQKKPDVYW